MATNKLVVGQPRPSTPSLGTPKVNNLHALVAIWKTKEVQWHSCGLLATRCCIMYTTMQALCTPNFMVWAHTLWLGTTTKFKLGAHDYTWHCPHTSPCLEEDTFNGNEAYPNLLGPVAMTQTTTQFLQKCIHPIHKLDKSGVVLISWRQVALLYPLYKIDSFTLDKVVPLHDVFRTTKMTNETHVRIK